MGGGRFDSPGRLRDKDKEGRIRIVIFDVREWNQEIEGPMSLIYMCVCIYIYMCMCMRIYIRS